MPDLRPCTGCQRHVENSESACPFCGVALAHAEPRPRFTSKLTRAAIFASATLATTACGGKSKPDTGNKVVQPARDDAGVEADAAGVPDVDVDPRHRGGGRDPNGIPMPYGAPPARRRVV